jgi:hypothetical protein
MARKIVNRLELRRESDAAERLEDDQEVETEEEGGDEEEEGDEDGEGKPKKKAKAKAKPKKEPAKRKSRAAAKEVRLKAYWGVFNQSMKRVALFEHSERKQADKKAEELSASQKSPHWVQSVKEAISE